MIDDDFHIQFSEKVEELRIVWRQLSIERNINTGELVEDFYQERFQDLSKIKCSAWILVDQMVRLVEELDSFRNKVEKMKTNPQTAELWETIETAIELMK